MKSKMVVIVDFWTNFCPKRLQEGGGLFAGAGFSWELRRRLGVLFFQLRKWRTYLCAWLPFCSFWALFF